MAMRRSRVGELTTLSFLLMTGTNAVPEPSTFALLGIGGLDPGRLRLAT